MSIEQILVKLLTKLNMSQGGSDPLTPPPSALLVSKSIK